MKIIRYENLRGEKGYAALREDGGALAIRGDIFSNYEVTGEAVNIQRLLAPVEAPVILCIGMNYRKHAIETKATVPEWPVLFIKPPTALQHPGAPIVIPASSDRVDYECELAIVIGKRCKNVNAGEALDYVLGYTCGNDVSARDWQIKRGGTQWCRGKGFDTFAPIGPCIVTRDEIPNPNALGIRTIVSGETLQEANTSDMIFSVAELVAFLSCSTTLMPGTVIFTGTPSGVGMARDPRRWLRPGDTVTVKIEKIGALTNPVVAEE